MSKEFLCERSKNRSLLGVFLKMHPSCSLVFHQQQSGLISRVTDTVKSIVPSWLQKYFKNEDGPEGGGSEQGRDLNCQLSPPPPPQPPNGNEEGPPVDGRDSPEPSTSNTGELNQLVSCIIKKFK